MQVTSNLISHVFCTFLLLTEEDMASCSRTFRKDKNAEEEGNLIQNVTPRAWFNYYYCIFFFWDGRREENTKI